MSFTARHVTGISINWEHYHSCSEITEQFEMTKYPLQAMLFV